MGGGEGMAQCSPSKYASATRFFSCNYPCQNMAVISDGDNLANYFVSV